MARSISKPSDHPGFYARDTQRSRFYRWMGAFVLTPDDEQLSVVDCQELVGRVCRDYRVPPPELVFEGRFTTPQFMPLPHIRGRIRLPAGKRVRPAILEELAHHLMFVYWMQWFVVLDLAGASNAPHGPDFLRLLIDLLVAYDEQDDQRLRSTAVCMNLRVAKHECYPQRHAAWDGPGVPPPRTIAISP